MKRFILLYFLILACSESQAPPPVSPLLSITRGNDQSDTVGKELPVPIEARLSDAGSGTPLPGRVVNWLVVAGGGTVFASATQTGSDGIAAQRWTLGGTAGEQRLVARWIDPETGQAVTIDTAKAVAMAGIAAILEVNFGPNGNPAGGNVWAVNDTVLVEYRFLDTYRNHTTSCADGGSIDRIVWTSSAPTIIQPLGRGRVIGGKRYAEFLAMATSPDPVVLTADPSDVCMDAPAAGVTGFVH